MPSCHFLGRVYVTQFFEFAERAHDIKPKPLARNVRETRRKLLLRGRYRFSVYALVFIGALFWCANTGIHVFGDPQLHWGHKVFDSVDHPMNFVLNRVNNFYTWVILLPFVGHIVIFSTIQLVRTTKRASIAGSLQYDLLNPDRRGGFIAIDRLHMTLNCLIAILYIQVALHTETFERMNIDHAIAYFSATVFLLCGNSVFFWPIRADVGKLKLAALNRQKCRVYRNEPQSLEVLKFFYELNSRRFEAFSFAIKAFALVVPAVVKAAPFFFGTPSQLILL
jgi:hypothetical protein